MDTKDLKSLLRQMVTRFCADTGAQWKRPIVETLHELRDQGWPGVFFGGTLRSLLLNRLIHGRAGRPRDIDLVVQGIEVKKLREFFNDVFVRETRFGGVQLQRSGWHFDMWPVHQTWAFQQDRIQDADFAQLPNTTFLNLEAIAVELWPQPGKARQIFSGDDQFFRALIEKTLEINRAENPFPTLCVVRSLVLAAKIQFEIGPRLSEYIVTHGTGTSVDELELVQKKHYGRIRWSGDTLTSWIESVAQQRRMSSRRNVRLPIPSQQTLWNDTSDDQGNPRVHVYAMRQ